MLAAAMNHAELPVRRRPKIAILATGDEVVPAARSLRGGSYRRSRLALPRCRGPWGEAMALGIAKDQLERIVTLARAGKAADIS